ncbi:MAG: glycosyl transferase, partial [Muribaculaceae bacterium]|nr:glycosyl transferase [Muribaculaceae bacterium]
RRCASETEGMAAGCFPVTFGRGGQADIVDHLTTGYIARYPDTADLAKGIRIGLDADPDTAIRLRKSVCDKFAADAVAEKYMRLLNT